MPARCPPGPARPRCALIPCSIACRGCLVLPVEFHVQPDKSSHRDSPTCRVTPPHAASDHSSAVVDTNGHTLPRLVGRNEPLGIPEGAPVVMIGGSYDPPHAWHLEIARAALKRVSQSGEAWLVLVPAGQSPLKGRSPEASANQRVEMARLAFAGIPNSIVWREEVDRAGESFTIDTVTRLRAELGAQRQAWFVIGSDQALQFHRWRRVSELLSLIGVLIALRPPITTRNELTAAMRESKAWSEEQLAGIVQGVLDLALSPLSSTSVRAGLAEGEPAGGGGLPATVAAYIAASGLYRGQAAGP
jgi:nicotinate-nucleotide adenylyltransferase